MYAEIVRTSGTQLISPVSRNVGTGLQRSSVTSKEKPAERTYLAAGHYQFTRGTYSRSVSVDELLEKLQQTAEATSSASEESPEERMQRDRIALIVRKFEGGRSSTEDETRIAILTKRLRKLFPRVTQMSIDAVNESVGALEETTGRIAELRAKYALT